MPNFWVGIVLVLIFAVHLRWTPAGGFPGWDDPARGLAALILPAIALGLVQAAILTRVTRSALLEALGEDFMRTAQAKGLNPLLIQLRHALRNALIPVTTVAGVHLGNLLGGAVVVETLFGWPGMGRLALEAILARDFSVLLGVLLLSSLLVIVANMLIDLLHAWLDPRIGDA